MRRKADHIIVDLVRKGVDKIFIPINVLHCLFIEMTNGADGGFYPKDGERCHPADDAADTGKRQCRGGKQLFIEPQELFVDARCFVFAVLDDKLGQLFKLQRKRKQHDG